MSDQEMASLTIRIPKELKERCERLAKERGVSLNRFITQTLEQFEAGEPLPASAEMRLLARIEKLEEAVRRLESRK